MSMSLFLQRAGLETEERTRKREEGWMFLVVHRATPEDRLPEFR
jgi:hypothetical protein